MHSRWDRSSTNRWTAC